MNRYGEELFDFPCSQTFRDFEELQMVDDGLLKEPFVPRLQVSDLIIPVHTKEYDQLQAESKFLYKKIIKLTDRVEGMTSKKRKYSYD